MQEYNLTTFLEDISINREFEFYYLNKMYSLTFVQEGYVFTDVQEQVYCIYQTYEDLLNSVRIRGLSIYEIIDKHLYENLTIF
ncbi:hypothetical protein [Helcococcus kunzii]|uniref:hypothetical protein n=1 Tax=Helcococcus kunzii TaxID=40091 RepID=UPI0024AE5240|nr:hypothetical protein [Helcococcus kunzii]